MQRDICKSHFQFNRKANSSIKKGGLSANYFLVCVRDVMQHGKSSGFNFIKTLVVSGTKKIGFKHGTKSRSVNDNIEHR